MKNLKNLSRSSIPLILFLSLLSFEISLASETNDPFSDDNVITIDANAAAKEATLPQKDKQQEKFDEIDDKQKDVLSVIKKKGKPSLEDVSYSIKNSMFGDEETNITKVEPAPKKDDEMTTLTEASEKEAQASANEEEQHPALQPIKNVKYYKELDWFSVIDHNQTAFAGYIQKLNLPSFTLDQLRDRTDSGIALVVNALAYDYGMNDAGMAENFYKAFLGRNDISFYDSRIRYADFLIRTGRPQKVLEFLNNGVCMNHINSMASCDYYLGVARYLMTGDNKNVNLRSAKDYFQKAGILFYQNDKKR